jgi:drug/metabolite transporter (DMT)-like permease
LDWFSASILATVLIALVSVMDKRLMRTWFTEFWPFVITFGLLGFARAGVLAGIWATSPSPFETEGVAWAAVSGVLWATGLALFFYVLSFEEVSRASPVQAITPVFTVLIAVGLYGESLSALQGAAMLMVIAGAVGVNLHRVHGRLVIARGRSLALLVLSALILGWAFVATDRAAASLDVVGVELVRTLTLAITVVALTWRPSRHHALVRALRRPAGLTGITLTEGVMAPVAIFVLVYALSVGPVSLVSTVFSAWPLVVLALSTALSTPALNLLNEPLDRQTLGFKTVSTVLIVAGVAALGW